MFKLVCYDERNVHFQEWTFETETELLERFERELKTDSRITTKYSYRIFEQPPQPEWIERKFTRTVRLA